MRRVVKLIMVSIVALSLAGPFFSSASATDVPTTKAECDKAGMKWKPQANKCKPRGAGQSLSSAKRVFGLIALLGQESFVRITSGTRTVAEERMNALILMQSDWKS